MTAQEKPPSPFYPGQPVPVELFVGRNEEFARIRRSAQEVAAGKPAYVFLVGDYGIGKTSLARFSTVWAKKELRLFPIHVLLGGARTMEQLAEKTVHTIIAKQALDPTAGESVRNFLAKYIGEQEIFGFKINLKALAADLPDITRGYGHFLREVNDRVGKTGYRGMFLVFDEINGIAGEKSFALFLKTLVDENALAESPIPLLLMLCGTDRIRQQIVDNHQPVERIFSISEMAPLTSEESAEFYRRAFESAGVTCEDAALRLMVQNCAGLPKLVHIIGDEVYYVDSDGQVSLRDAMDGVLRAADEVGRKFIDPRVYDAISSESYRVILGKLPDVIEVPFTFQRSELTKQLDAREQGRMDNFLQKMKDVGVLRSGSKSGEYVFSDPLTALYITMRETGASVKKKESSPGGAS